MVLLIGIVACINCLNLTGLKDLSGFLITNESAAESLPKAPRVLFHPVADE